MAAPLRIGVNALYLIPGGVGGTEIYLRNLLAALAEIDTENHYSVFVNRETVRAEPPLAPAAGNFHAVVCPIHARNRPARLVWEQLVLPARAAKLRIDVLFSPGFTSPLIATCPKVTVIHDLQHVRQPENFGRLELAAWRASVWTSVHFSRALITVSENSRHDIVEVYGIRADRVHAIAHGVEPEFFRLCQDASLTRPIPQPYLLSVSTVHPHKNWGRWLEAFHALAAEGLPHHLIMAGVEGNYSRQLTKAIERWGLGERVHRLGWVERRTLLALFRFADALVFPSTFEGFGMPVLEAMAAGLPVACSDIPPLHEAAGPAAVYFDSESVESIAAAVRRLLSDAALRAHLATLGRENAAGFTWPRAAERTLAVLREAADQKVVAA